MLYCSYINNRFMLTCSIITKDISNLLFQKQKRKSSTKYSKRKQATNEKEQASRQMFHVCRRTVHAIENRNPVVREFAKQWIITNQLHVFISHKVLDLVFVLDNTLIK